MSTKNDIPSIRWIHISDIHLRSGNEWSQNVVLRAMCNSIKKESTAGKSADFILVTGDIAFSGKAEEYNLAVDFFDKIQTASGVPRDRIFCVAGNHDIDRTRKKLCFRGCRTALCNQSHVDTLLGNGDDLETLLLRQENYRQFQDSYFANRDIIRTEDKLGYVSRLNIGEVLIAIVGLDSAWLAEGGDEDHGKLVIGERQVINAVELTQQGNETPDVIIGIAHHPLHWLQEFDHHVVRHRIEDTFHFFHCGHIHQEPEGRITSTRDNSHCLILTAGALYETRQSRNAYCIVKLDLLRATREVKNYLYNPNNGDFSLGSSNKYRFWFESARLCNVKELAIAMEKYCPDLSYCAHYLSALLLNQKAEFPIPTQTGCVFGSLDLLQDLTDDDIKNKAAEFLTFRNVLHVLSNRMQLSEILDRHGNVLIRYGETLTDICASDSAFRLRLKEQEEDACKLAGGESSKVSSHTLNLLNELSCEQDWSPLRQQAERHMESVNPAVATSAKSMLALALANSDEPSDKKKAIEHYQSLSEAESADLKDIGNLAILLAKDKRMDDAAAVVLDGIKKFPAKANYFSDIGQKIVEATGNRNLRKQIENMIREVT